MKPRRIGVARRQTQVNASLKSLVRRQSEIRNHGHWLWKEYGVELERVSVVVLGENVFAGNLELVALVTLHSECAIPHAGESRQVTVKKDGSYVTLVQLGNSAFTPHFSSAVLITYVGTDPPIPDRPPPG